jgi:glucokinase
VVDAASGKLENPAGLPAGWNNWPLRERFATCAGQPVNIYNNAMAAAYGEFWVGAAEKFPSLVLLTLGTHVGCGVIFGESSIDSQNRFGVESPHMIIDCTQEAATCRCGQRGHLEAYISDAAIIRSAQQAVTSRRATSLARRMEQGAPLTVDLISREASAGDEVALEVVAVTARHLGVGVVNIMNTIDPKGILFGGTTTFGGTESPLGRQFLLWIKEEVARRAFASMINRTNIDFAALNGNAVYLGAAGLARQEYLRQK